MIRHALFAAALLSLLAGCSDGTATADGTPSQTQTQTPSPVTRQLTFLVDPGVTAPDVFLPLPPSYTYEQPWYVVSADRQEFLGFWAVKDVTYDACHPRRHKPTTPGPTPRDLADALVAQRSTEATAGTPVTLSGYDGVYVEITGPSDLAGCAKYPSLWVNPERGIYGDAQVDRLWILNVDGQRLVVDASYSSASTPEDIETLTAMVEAIEIASPADR